VQDLISIFIGAIITTLSGVIFGKSVLKEKIQIKKIYIILIVVANSIITMFWYYLNLVAIKAIVGFFLYFLLFKITFKMTGIKSFLTSVVFYIMLFASEIIFLLISTIILNLSANNTYLQFGGTLLGNVCISLLILLLGYLLRKILRVFINLKVPKSFMVYCAWSCFCLTLLLIAFAIDTNLSIKPFLIIGMAIMVLLTLFVLLNQKYKNHELTLKYDKLLEFIKKYEIEIDNQRILRHETKNQFIVIKSKIIDKDQESKIIEYINEIIEETNHKINNSEYAKLRYLPSNGLKGLFYFKVSEAIERKINIDINISKKIENSFIGNLNSQTFNQLGKVLGIFIDNAIEAAEISDEKKIGIEIYREDNEITFIISNTHNNVTNNKGRSSKGPNRGHGLLLARQIINLNDKLTNETIITDDVYIQKLKITE